MQFKRSLALAGIPIALIAGGLALGAPANAATAPSPTTISFDLTASDPAGASPAPSAHVAISSDTGFQAGQPVTITITNVNGVQSNTQTSATGNTGYVTAPTTITTVPGDKVVTMIELAGQTNGRYRYVRFSNFVLPTAGVSSMAFDLAGVDSWGTVPWNESHVVLTSDDKFQPGSTTSATVTANDPTDNAKVSSDGTTWGATATGTAPIGQALPALSVTGTTTRPQTVTGTISNLVVTAFPVPAPVVTNQTIGQDNDTLTVSGTGEAGDAITIHDDSGAIIATATVASDGTWSATITGPAGGAGTVVQTNPNGGDSAPVAITIPTILGTPIVNPFVAGGAGIAALGALGVVLLVRRRKTAAQA